MYKAVLFFFHLPTCAPYDPFPECEPGEASFSFPWIFYCIFLLLSLDFTNRIGCQTPTNKDLFLKDKHCTRNGCIPCQVCPKLDANDCNSKELVLGASGCMVIPAFKTLKIMLLPQNNCLNLSGVCKKCRRALRRWMGGDTFLKIYVTHSTSHLALCLCLCTCLCLHICLFF